MQEIEIFYPASLTDWRNWLEENHLSKQAVWLVFYTKGSGKPSITWSNAVDVALCFGWIDSKKIKIDEETSHQFFSKRKPTSTWSRINKDKVNRLMEEQLMTNAGFKTIEIAKQNGSWTILDEVEKLVIPEDLESELKTKPFALDYFQNLSKSVRKAILQWVTLAKRPETRQKRITEIVELAAQKQKPKHLQ
ncbi:YdeI/OmpD-associated family protein [Adhaeribacter radiodurans]|uniref:YdeI/OmpD-associated family protein n=1 Tax=Adhaeribacter radiodurans TaxID=2745197 RepID=A0A7L7LCN5_9BACT|nr:YdeI/OmpD-associated family protein [Adhaeribacter radiodurans]QMU30606.1 YdeI/OmpD-associated family protein [Adhaeribacter radiodurans]